MLLILWRAGGVVAGHQVLVGIETGDQCHQRWAAQGGGYVAATEGGALGGEFVEVRRLDRRVPHEAVVGPRLVVGEDQDDVGWLVGSEQSAAEEQGEDGFEKCLHGAVWLRLREARRSHYFLLLDFFNRLPWLVSWLLNYQGIAFRPLRSQAPAGRVRWGAVGAANPFRAL